MANNMSLPLFKLPNRATTNVLSIFCLEEQVKFVVLSKRSAKSMAAVNNELRPSRVYCYSNSVHINLFTPFQPMSEWIFQKINNWRDNGCSLEYFVDAIKTAFNLPFIANVTMEDNQDSGYDMKMLKALRDVRNLFIHTEAAPDFYNDVLNALQPVRALFLDYGRSDMRDWHKVFIQDFDQISLRYTRENENRSKGLDDLLVTNSAYIFLHCSVMDRTVLVRFLKCWKTGANPRMRYLKVVGSVALFEVDTIVRKLNATAIPAPRTFPTVSQGWWFREPVTIDNGYYIQRKDGKQATFHFPPNGILELFVHDN